MKAYFEKKIGEKLTKEFKTGEKFYTKVYARVYFFEVLKVYNNGNVRFEVSSRDKAPVGLYEGEKTYYGEFETEIGDKSKSDILMDIVKQCDMKFLKEYKFA